MNLLILVLAKNLQISHFQCTNFEISITKMTVKFWHYQFQILSSPVLNPWILDIDTHFNKMLFFAISLLNYTTCNALVESAYGTYGKEEMKPKNDRFQDSCLITCHRYGQIPLSRRESESRWSIPIYADGWHHAWDVLWKAVCHSFIRLELFAWFWIPSSTQMKSETSISTKKSPSAWLKYFIWK